MNNWMMFRPLVEGIYRLFGYAPTEHEFIAMTDERRRWIERTYGA